MGRARGVSYSPARPGARSPLEGKGDSDTTTEVAMKVQTDVKGGGLLGITAIVIIDIDVNLFGGCGRKCGYGC